MLFCFVVCRDRVGDFVVLGVVVIMACVICICRVC